MERPPYMDVARDVLAQFHPNARCAFVAGSITRGEGTASSDIDLVVMYDDFFEDVHRDTLEEQGWLVELFVQNEMAQEYFFAKDIARGVAIMPHMVAFGHVIGPDVAYGVARQARARALYEQGPSLLRSDEIDQQRYFISSALDDACDPRPALEQIAILCDLFEKSADFSLRTARAWSGSGKHRAKRLRALDPDLAQAFEEAFTQALTGDMDLVVQLMQKILAPYGGFLQIGYKAIAPQDWKNFVRPY